MPLHLTPVQTFLPRAPLLAPRFDKEQLAVQGTFQNQMSNNIETSLSQILPFNFGPEVDFDVDGEFGGKITNPPSNNQFPSKFKLASWIFLSLVTACSLYGILRLFSYANIAKLTAYTQISNADLRLLPDNILEFSVIGSNPYKSPLTLDVDQAKVSIEFQGKSFLQFDLNKFELQAGFTMNFEISNSLVFQPESLLLLAERIAENLHQEGDSPDLIVQIDLKINLKELFFRSSSVPYFRPFKFNVGKGFLDKLKAKLDRISHLNQGLLSVGIGHEKTEDSLYFHLYLSEYFNELPLIQNWSIKMLCKPPAFKFKGFDHVLLQFQPFELSSNEESQSNLQHFFSLGICSSNCDAVIFDHEYYRSIWKELMALKQWIFETASVHVENFAFPAVSVISPSSSAIGMASQLKTKLPLKSISFFSSISCSFALKCEGVSVMELDLVFPENGQEELLPVSGSAAMQSSLKFTTDSSSFSGIAPKWTFELKLFDEKTIQLPELPDLKLEFESASQTFHFSLPKADMIFTNKACTSKIGIAVERSEIFISQSSIRCQSSAPALYAYQAEGLSTQSLKELSIGYLSFNGTSVHNEEGSFAGFLDNTLHIFPIWTDIGVKMQTHALPLMESFLQTFSLDKINDFFLKIGNSMFIPLKKTSHPLSAVHNRISQRQLYASLIQVACEAEKRDSTFPIEFFFDNIFAFIIHPKQRQELSEICPITKSIVDTIGESVKDFENMDLTPLLLEEIRQKFPHFEPIGLQKFISHPLVILFVSKIAKEATRRFFLDNPSGKHVYNVFLDRISHTLQQSDVSEFVDSELLFNGTDGMNLDEIPSVFVEALSMLTKKIFKETDIDAKIRIFTKVLTLNHDASIYTMIGTSVSCLGGIAVLKLLQLLSDTMSNLDLAESMNAIKSELPAMKPETFQSIIEFSVLDETLDNLSKFTEKNSNSDLLLPPESECIAKPASTLMIQRKPVGSATLSQGHIGFIKKGSKKIPVFVKILKDHVYPEFLHEVKSIDEIAEMYPTVSSVFEEIKTDYENEFDLDLEITYMRRAYQLYSSAQILVPQFIQSYQMKYPGFGDAPITCMIVMEYIKGISIDKLNLKDLLETKLGNDLSRLKEHFISIYNLVLSLLYTFMSVGLFNQGFIHGDLHAGNILLQIDYQNPANNKIIPIDYGNCHELDSRLRNNILMIGIGVELKDARMIAQGLGYDTAEKGDEILWKKQMGDVHYYLEFHRMTKAEKEEFFIRKIEGFTIMKFFYSIEFRLKSALNPNTELARLLDRQMELSKRYLHAVNFNFVDFPTEDFIRNCEEILEHIKSPANQQSALHHNYDIVTWAIIYLFCHSKINHLQNINVHSMKYSEKMQQIIQKIEKISILDRRSMENLYSVLFKHRNHAPVNVKDCIEYHQIILEVLASGQEFKNETFPESPMKFLFDFMPLSMELIHTDFPVASPFESEIKERFNLYLQMNEYRYLMYLNTHMSICTNVLQREIYSLDQIITPPKNFKSTAPDFAPFKPQHFRVLNFIRESIKYRTNDLPNHRIVGFVTEITAHGNKNLGTGHKIMKVFRSQAMLENVSEVLKDKCLDFFDFDQLKLKTTSETGRSVGLGIGWKKTNILSSIKIGSQSKLSAIYWNKAYQIEDDFLPERAKIV